MPQYDRSGKRAVERMALLIKAHGTTDPIDLAIAVLSGSLQRHWDAQVRAALDELLDRVSSLADDRVSSVLDPLERDSLLEQSKAATDLAAALILALELRLATPPPAPVLAASREAATRLVLEGASHVGLTGARGIGSTAAVLQEASDDLSMTMRARLTGTRRKELQDDILRLVTNRRVRVVPVRLSEWREGVEDLLGAPAKTWVPLAIEDWAVRWRSIGSLEAAEKEGLSLLYALNPLDHRTSTFCRWLHGRPIEVAEARGQVDSYLEAMRAGDAEEARRAWPLLALKPGMTDKDFELLEQKIGLPPYHGRCRTQAISA